MRSVHYDGKAQRQIFIYTFAGLTESTMNPAEYGLLWMGQYGPERMMLDDHNMLSVGMSVMDDISHPNHSMVSCGEGTGSYLGKSFQVWNFCAARIFYAAK